MSQKPLVSIDCITYNHSPYIRQCLDGMLMQQTSFPFEILIHDDASTDDTAEIIREYEARYPDIIKPIYQTENQWSKNLGSISARFNWPRASGKYIALCEGDDYWTDPLKLQKQVDFLEAHPDYSMACSDAFVISPKGELDFSISKENTTIPLNDMVRGGGLYVQTATLIYRNELMDDYPECCMKCHVGDYPLQIFMTLKGKVYYFAEKMATYRMNMGNSWTARHIKLPIADRIKSWRNEVEMLMGLDEYSKHIYTDIFQRHISDFIFSHIYGNPYDAKQIISAFDDLEISFDKSQRHKIIIMKMGLFPVLKKLRNLKYRLKDYIIEIRLSRQQGH